MAHYSAWGQPNKVGRAHPTGLIPLRPIYFYVPIREKSTPIYLSATISAKAVLGIDLKIDIRLSVCEEDGFRVTFHAKARWVFESI